MPGALLMAVAVTGWADGDPARGKTLYQTRCAACHSIDYSGAGPAHRGLFGRLAGQVPGYTYSEALKSSGVVWSDGTLNRWLTDPEAFVPGQKMGISVPDAQERVDLIAYLKQATKPAIDH